MKPINLCALAVPLVVLAVGAGALPALAGESSARQGGDDGGQAVASAELMEIWQVTRIGPLDLGPDDGVTMQVADGRIAGRSGCNRYTGPVALTAETLSSGGLELGALAGTQMACPEPASRIESAFLTAIRQVDGYQLTATGGLVLTAGDSELIQAERVLPD